MAKSDRWTLMSAQNERKGVKGKSRKQEKDG